MNEKEIIEAGLKRLRETKEHFSQFDSDTQRYIATITAMSFLLCEKIGPKKSFAFFMSCAMAIQQHGPDLDAKLEGDHGDEIKETYKDILGGQNEKRSH